MSLGISMMCSRIAPSATLAIDEKVKAFRAAGEKVVSFGAGEPDFDTPDAIVAATCDAARHGMTRYTPVGGTAELKSAIIKKLQRDNGLRYTPAQIVVSSGAKHSLSTLFQTILDPGDEVLIPVPCWVSYPEMVRMAGGVPVFVPTNERGGFLPTAAAIRQRVTSRTKALMLTDPSNPTGAVYPVRLLREIAEIAVESAFYVVSDEIYEKFLYDGRTHVSIASLGDDIRAQTLLVNGVSKSYAMTGFRIGYTAGPEDVIRAMTTLQSQATSNANSIAQHAAAVALTGSQDSVETMRAAFELRRDRLIAGIRAISGLSCTAQSGAFYVMLNMTGLIGDRLGDETITSAMDFATMLLRDAKVAVVPGEAFMAPGYCRMSYAVDMADIEEGLRRIAAFVARLESPVGASAGRERVYACV